MLSGSRLPPPTFRVHVIMPLCVTDMMRLATEHAFSCRVASTICRWPTCRTSGRVRGMRMRACTWLFRHITGLITWAHLAQRHYTGNILHIESHAVIRVVGQLDLLPSFLVCRYMHFGNSDQEGNPISFNFPEYNILEIQTKHFTYFVLNSAALTAMEMASYRLPSHCRSCGNERF